VEGALSPSQMGQRNDREQGLQSDYGVFSERIGKKAGRKGDRIRKRGGQADKTGGGRRLNPQGEKGKTRNARPSKQNCQESVPRRGKDQLSIHRIF